VSEGSLPQTALGTLPASSGLYSKAKAINAAGLILGCSPSSLDPYANTHAVLWQPGSQSHHC
jgi:hypothetical protein